MQFMISMDREKLLSRGLKKLQVLMFNLCLNSSVNH